jgi:predicted kinase
MNQKILLCTMGLPRSGKSTWAKEQAFPVVNPDSIRLAMHGQRFYQQAEDLVWAHAKLMVRSLFIAGHHTVIVDATNGTKRRRAMWFDDDWVTYWKLFDTSREECIARAVKNSDPDIIPVIEQLATAWEPLDDKAMRW